MARIDPRTLQAPASTYTDDGTVGLVVADDTVWVLNAGARTVTRFDPPTLDPRGGTIQVGQDPTAIAAGDGAIWVTERSGVRRINAATGKANEFRVGSRPVAIAVGGGAAWVANAGDGTVSRIDTVSGVVSEIHVGGEPSGIAYADDFVWVAVQHRGRLMRHAPSSRPRRRRRLRRRRRGVGRAEQGPTVQRSRASRRR